MFCPRCGGNLPDDAVFCPKCGERIGEDSENIMYCHKCGKQIGDTTLFCKYCGVSTINSIGTKTIETSKSVDETIISEKSEFIQQGETDSGGTSEQLAVNIENQPAENVEPISIEDDISSDDVTGVTSSSTPESELDETESATDDNTDTRKTNTNENLHSQSINPEKNSHLKVILFVALAIIGIIVSVFFMGTGTPGIVADDPNEKVYDEALNLLNKGDYAAAATSFETLGNYRDATDKYKESVYCAAYVNIENGAYEKAKEMLNELNGYYNVSDLITYCDYQIRFAEIESFSSQGRYGEAYKAIMELPACAETASILNRIVSEASVDLVQLEADFDANEVRAKNEYKGKFFIISGVVQGFSTSFWDSKDYMQIKVGRCSDYAHCYGLTTSELVSFSTGDSAMVAGYFEANYGWIGIDFNSCEVVDSNYLYASKPISLTIDTTNAFLSSAKTPNNEPIQSQPNGISPNAGGNSTDTADVPIYMPSDEYSTWYDDDPTNDYDPSMDMDYPSESALEDAAYTMSTIYMNDWVAQIYSDWNNPWDGFDNDALDWYMSDYDYMYDDIYDGEIRYVVYATVGISYIDHTGYSFENIVGSVWWDGNYFTNINYAY